MNPIYFPQCGKISTTNKFFLLKHHCKKVRKIHISIIFLGCSLLVSSVNGSLLWSLKWDSDRPISAIKCCPKNKNFAVGDSAGRIRVYKDSTKESFSQAHWHSLSIQALQLSQDGVQLYSGEHEGKN